MKLGKLHPWVAGATSGAFGNTVKFWQQCKNINIMTTPFFINI